MAVILENLSMIYKLGETDILALDDVSLRVKCGELLAVLGPSGSGKSTLLNIIGGLDRPTTGRVFVNKEDLGKLNESRLARFRANNIGFVFQLFNLIPTFTALENVMTPAEILGSRGGEARRKAEEALEKVGLKERLNHFPSQLAGGEQQRVAIARALVNDPGLLLCDEPTGNLDTKTGAEIIRLLRNANLEKDITMIVVTHDQRISRSANRTIELVDGRIIGER